MKSIFFLFHSSKKTQLFPSYLYFFLPRKKTHSLAESQVSVAVVGKFLLSRWYLCFSSHSFLAVNWRPEAMNTKKNGDLSAPQQSKWLLQPAGFSGQPWMMAEPGGSVAISYLLERRGPDTSACWMLPGDKGSHDGICTLYLQRAEYSRARKDRIKVLGITSRWLNSLLCSSFLPLYAAEFELRTAFLASRIGGSE